MTDTTVAPYPTRVPTGISSLALLIERMPPGPSDGPDLWDRLVAQEGTTEATRLWDDACLHLDQAASA